MAEYDTDIVIYGAGIAGLWLHSHLNSLGYDCLLLESNEIGGGQTIASQGIIHSGLKYALAGKVNELARSISRMPDVWRECLAGKGPVDLRKAKLAASSQYLLIPGGLAGGIIKLATQKTLGEHVREISENEWPENLRNSGFKGTTIFMNEPVLDIPSVIRALAAPHQDSIRKPDGNTIKARRYIYTAAAGNETAAKKAGHDKGLSVQHRPLLMAMMKNAPYPLFTHLVGASEKPVVTVTTHQTEDGALVWYLGGSVAERQKTDPPETLYKAAEKALKKYLPGIDFTNMEWAALPVDRVEGKSRSQGWLPDTPTIHKNGDTLYCWPTKLTFAPMLSDMVIKELEKDGIKPSNTSADWPALPQAGFAKTPWDKAQWTKRN